MKKTQYAIIGFFSLLFILSIFAMENVMKESRGDHDTFPIEYLYSDDGAMKIKPWEQENGEYYFFLPGNYDVSSLRFHIAEASLLLDQSTINSDTYVEELLSEGSHQITIEGSKQFYPFQVFYSSDIPSMYINTASGNMEYVHKNKKNQDIVSLSIYDQNGKLNYSNAGDTITGRGNTTWELDKKPYNLTLEEASSLLGMDSSQKWVLLANGYDEGNLKNKIVYDFANDIGAFESPQCEWVDLWVNGTYEGLYLLCEKANIETLDTFEEDDFLVTSTFAIRAVDEQLVTNRQHAFDIEYPKKYTTAEAEHILQSLNAMEASLCSSDSLESILDLDSWKKKYLVEEIFANPDIASLYFYYSAKDGKIYAGPAWDYDCSMGASSYNRYSRSPYSFIVKQEYLMSTNKNSWFYEFCRNEEIYASIQQLYKEEVAAVLEQYITSVIPEYVSRIHASSQMNKVRWNSIFSSFAYQSTTEQTLDFLTKRYDFLQKAWIEDRNYYNVQIDRGGMSYMYVSVEEGQELADVFPTNFDLGMSADLQWYEKESKTPVQEYGTLSKDITVVWTNASASVVSKSAKIKYYAIVLLKYAYKYFVLLLFALLFLVLLFFNYKNKRKGVPHGKSDL